METGSVELKNEQLILEDNNQYFYSIKAVEITNALGAVKATLFEYSISNNNTQNYKLYKTKEGNWYDIPEANPTAENAIILSLKLAINYRENLRNNMALF
jgi:hypothetical protein